MAYLQEKVSYIKYGTLYSGYRVKTWPNEYVMTPKHA